MKPYIFNEGYCGSAIILLIVSLIGIDMLANNFF